MFTLENQQKLAANLLKNFLNSQIMIGETTMQKQEEEITKQQEEPIVEETPTTIEESMSDTKTDQTVFDVAEKDKLLMERLDMIASLLEKQQQIIDTFQTKLNSLEEKRELKVFKPLSVTNEISLKDSLFKRV